METLSGEFNPIASEKNELGNRQKKYQLDTFECSAYQHSNPRNKIRHCSDLELSENTSPSIHTLIKNSNL